MTELKVGDVVRLKSGGPKMTVEEVRPTSVVCIWFTGDGAENFRREYFSERTLEKEESK